MIVSPLPHGQGWRLVTQRDHARMAGRLAEAWLADPAVSPAAWRALIGATHRHDDGWADEDAQPRVDPSGKPIDFKSMPPAEHVAVWRRSLNAAELRDPIEAWLIGLHAASLYERFSRQDPASQAAATDLLEDVNRRTPGWREAGARLDPPLGDGQAQRLARILSWIDGLTLAMAEAIPWPQHGVELDVAGRPVSLVARRVATDRIELAPWPMPPEKPCLPVELPERVVSFGSVSPQALQDVMTRPATTVRRWSIAPA